MALADAEAREQHRDLRRDRHAGGVKQHEHEDADQTQIGDDMSRPRRDLLCDGRGRKHGLVKDHDRT